MPARGNLLGLVVGYSEVYTKASGELAAITRWGRVVSIIHAVEWFVEIDPLHDDTVDTLIPFDNIHTIATESY